MIVGANPGAREVTFEGDHQPLSDLKKLFECRLGEDGVASLHPDLAYLARK